MDSELTMQSGYSLDQEHESSVDVELSVVIVTYNEEDRIQSCIESVFSACANIPSFEIILIDSNSSDQTVDIALEYPITVAKIPDETLTTPSAGRYIGTKLANAPAILFVDGDMVLSKEWLDAAIPLLEQPNVAGVDGQLNEPRSNAEIVETDVIRGIALYDAHILNEVGGFDPYLQSMEDIHLGFTVRDAGYTLLRLSSVAGYHPTRPTVTEPIRRWKNGYMEGTGQVVRRSLNNQQLLFQYFSRLRYQLFLIFWLGIGIFSLPFLPLFLIWSITSIIGAGLVATKLGVSDMVGFFFGKIITIPGFIRGLLLTPKDADEYPLERVEQLKFGPIHQSESAHQFQVRQ